MSIYRVAITICLFCLGLTSWAGNWKDAGPIFNQADATSKCPTTCENWGRQWNGQWRTIDNGATSICQCKRHHHSRHHYYPHHFSHKHWLNAGPIWNQSDAQNKCQSTCQTAQQQWTGQWRTIDNGATSVCQCQR